MDPQGPITNILKTEDRDKLTSMKMQSTKSHWKILLSTFFNKKKLGGGRQIQEELAMKNNCKYILTNNNMCTLFGS